MPSTFELAIVGDIIKPGDDQTLLNILKSRFDIFAPDHKIGVYHFQRITYRVIIDGTPERFEYLDNMIKAVKTHSPKYLRNWGYSIKVKFVESG